MGQDPTRFEHAVLGCVEWHSAEELLGPALLRFLLPRWIRPWPGHVSRGLDG